jgi:hypothetical protein
MHPTPEEQLRAIERRLAEVAEAEPSLSASSRHALDDTGRLIRRLEGSLAKRLPFLQTDNELAARLLADLAPLLPDLTAEIDAALGVGSGAARTDDDADQAPIDEPRAHEHNKRLQGLLGRAVHLLPDNPEGDAGRAHIAAHLRSRLAADPVLNRTPIPRPDPSDREVDP